MSDPITHDRLLEIQEALEKLQKDTADLHLKLDWIMRHLGKGSVLSERQAWETAWSQSYNRGR